MQDLDQKVGGKLIKDQISYFSFNLDEVISSLLLSNSDENDEKPTHYMEMLMKPYDRIFMWHKASCSGSHVDNVK